jgi:hypothetical protein
MKNVTLLFILFFSLSSFAEEISIQNFESGFTGKWGTNGNIGNTPDENHENFSIVDNPAKTEINTSNKVGKLHRLRSGNWWALAWFEFNEIQVEASMSKPKYLHVSIYKPIVSTVCIQVKDIMIAPEQDTKEIKNDKQTKVNEWQDLVFKITTSGTFKLMEIKPDFINQSPADRLDSDIDIYFDNIVINDDPTPLGEDPEPLPEFKGNLPEGFEGENTLLDPLFYEERFGTFGQETASTDLTVVENPAKIGINTTNKCAKFVRKISGQWWAGAFMTPLDPVSVDAAHKYFHVMVYREIEATPLSLKLETSNDNTGDIILQGDEAGMYDWVDYVFEIPAEKYGTYEKIAFMPDFYETIPPSERFFDDAAIYFDAMELNNNPVPRTSAEINGLYTLESDPLKAWKEASGDIKIHLPQNDEIHTVELFSVTGQITNKIRVNGSERIVSIPGIGLQGIYLIRLTSSGGKYFMAKICL